MKAKVIGILASVLLSLLAAGQTGTLPAPASDPQELVEAIYDLVSFGPGNPARWDEVRDLFHEDAIIVLRTGVDKSTKFTVDGFIEDFQKFAENEKVKTFGFSERIIRLKRTVFGDIAHFLVLYEATVHEPGFKPQQGVDSFQLVRLESEWKILSITNEITGTNNPLPAELTD